MVSFRTPRAYAIAQRKQAKQNRQKRITERASERWYSGRVGNTIPDQNTSQKGSAGQIINIGGHSASSVLYASLTQPIAEHTIYEMNKREVEIVRSRYYYLNSTGRYQFYTRYLDGRYLLVIRMK